MLEIIIGRSGTGKTQKCLDSMKAFLDQRGLKARIFLLMPAYMTYQTERQFAQMTNGQTNTYAFSFQRFARQILEELGGANVPKVTDIGRRMILRKILMRRDKEKELRYFARTIKQSGFSETLAETIKELRTYDITPEMLRQATADIEDEELCDKALDLAMLSEDFREAMDGKNYDDEDIIELAASKIQDSKLCRDAEIYIDGFVFFDPLQRKIIRELLKYARNVHITLPMETDLNANENDEEIGLFRQSMKTFKMLRQMSIETDIKMDIVRCNKNHRFKRGALKVLEENLFAFPPTSLQKIEGNTDSIKIIEAATPRVEVEAVAQDILKIKEQRGYKFRDIGILIRDEKYNNYIKAIFERHEIPFFSSEKRKAVHHPLIDVILSSLAMLTSNRPDILFYCLRSGLFDISRDDTDLLENYTIEFGIKGLKTWYSSKPWTYYRREFDIGSDEIPEKTREQLKKINALRQRVMDYFSEYFEAMNKKNLSVKEIASALFELLERLEVPQKLDDWSQKAAAEGDLALSRMHLSIWNELVKMLEQFVEIMGSDVISIKEFEALLNEGIEAINMSFIPQGLDEITVANLNQNSLQNTKAIYILGVNEGKMPGITNEKGLFSDAERYYLSQAGLEVHAGKIENSLAEKFLLYRGFTEASEYLCLTYSLSDSGGEMMKRSPLIDTIRKLIVQAPIEFVTVDILASNPDTLFIVDDKTISVEKANKLFSYNNVVVRSSVSRVEQFMKCPFKHFAQYGLKLEERKEYAFNSLDLGNLLHSALRKFGERMKAEGRRWSSVESDELRTIVDEIFEEIVPRFQNTILKSNATYLHQLERIKRVAIRSLLRLIEFDAQSHFHAEKLEVDFGLPDSSEALKLELDNNMKLNLTGRIDRIDFSEDNKYFLVIDYKTGHPSINLLDVYCGLNLQLLTYLLVANEHLVDKVPAAMLYFFLSYPMRSDRSRMTEEEARKSLEKYLAMPGWVLADPKVIKEIDKSLKFIKVNLTKNGGIYKSSAPYVKSKEQFDLLLNHVAKTLTIAGNRIVSGDIEVKPYKADSKGYAPCKFCPYIAVCSFEQSFEKRNWRELPKLDDNKIFELMKAEEWS